MALAIHAMSCMASADMGRIYVSSEPVTVSEDAQKAIILHNLSEQVLILGTDLKASRPIGIVRFIPFPSEPSVTLAPADAFEKAAAMIKKYGLKYQYVHYSKGGSVTTESQGVEIRLNEKLGAHDVTVIKVNDVTAFRQWVNTYFKTKGLPVKETYPDEEAIVRDYVQRGVVYFVLDFVEIASQPRFIEPIAYRFSSKTLYYPLKTTNTFGGKGSIELIIIAPTTLCAAGNEPLDPYSGALYREQHPQAQRPYGQRPLCLNLPVIASTSEMLVKEENDLDGLYPGGQAFFKDQPAFIQVVQYVGRYAFKEDVFADVATGLAGITGRIEEDPDDQWDSVWQPQPNPMNKRCNLKPDPGPCKGRFERYYFDPAGNTCKVFFWGGCGGVVPFETEDQCKSCIQGR